MPSLHFPRSGMYCTDTEPESVIDFGLSCRKLSCNYNVPIATLDCQVAGRCPAIDVIRLQLVRSGPSR